MALPALLPPDPSPKLSPFGQTVWKALETRAPDVAARIAPRLGGPLVRPEMLGALAEASFAYSLLAAGVEFSYEPTVTAQGRLEFRHPRPGDRRSDFAVRCKSRWVNVEIKTPTANTHPDRGPFDNALRERVALLQRRGILTGSALFLAADPIGKYFKRCGEVGDILEEELKVLAGRAGMEAPGPSRLQPVRLDGSMIGWLALTPAGSPSPAPAREGENALPHPARHIVNAQLVHDGPNVFVLNLDDRGLLDDSPQRKPLVACGSSGGAFAEARYAKVSLLYVRHTDQRRFLLANPRARHPLTVSETELFEKVAGVWC